MEALIFALAIICILIGYLAARGEYKRKLASVKRTEYARGFDHGFQDAFKDVDAVRRAYIYHFQTR